LLAALAGRIYDDAPQQNAFPLDDITGQELGMGPMELVMVVGWLIPITAFAFFVFLAVRFVRAAERIAAALEVIARLQPPT
jgi:hypothetical protein